MAAQRPGLTQALGMYVKHPCATKAAFLALACLLGCAKPDEISYERAVEISREVAQKKGYDLRRYELDTFGDPTGGGDKEWLIAYRCKPAPPPPGC